MCFREVFEKSRASCFPLFPVFGLSEANRDICLVRISYVNLLLTHVSSLRYGGGVAEDPG